MSLYDEMGASRRQRRAWDQLLYQHSRGILE